MLSGVGIWEIVLLAVLAVFLFGAKKLPDIARSAGKGMREFKDSAKEFKKPIEEVTDLVEVEEVKDLAALRSPKTALARMLDDKPESEHESTSSTARADS
jgi:sec-independent protein translocase protein TatA